MARKGRLEAEAQTQRAHQARLLYLSRSPEFRKDIASLLKDRDALPGNQSEFTPERRQALHENAARLGQVGKKWGVSELLLSQLYWPGWQAGLDPKEHIPAAAVLFDWPVIASTDASLSLFGIDARPPTPEDHRYLNLRVDLDHPVDVLLPLIEKELGRFSRGYRDGRRRLKEVDFYVSVFDLAESGETFKAISLKLNRPLSTVKSAFLKARRNIFGSPAAPSKKDLPLASFQVDAHEQKCQVCRKAETFEQMCPQAQKYALQGYKSQRELTGLNPVRDTRDKDDADT
jgi:hypothetical protein